LTGGVPSGDSDAHDLPFPDDLDPKLKDTCRKAMATSQDERFESMQEFAAALSEFQQTLERPSDADPRPLATPGDPPRRPKLGRVLILSVAAVAIVSTLVALALRGAKPQQNPVLPQPASAVKDAEQAAEREQLLTGLKDAKLDVRRTSAERLRDFKSTDVVTALVDRVGDDYWPDSREANGSDRAEALLSLRLLDKAALPAALDKAMHSENDRVRTWACTEIVHLADPKLEPALIAALKDRKSRVRTLAADGLRLLRWDSKAVIDALVQRVTEPWVFRQSGASAEDLSDPRPSGRDAAMEALIALNPDEAEAVLDKAVASTSSHYRVWANQVRGRFLGKKP
jgi:hypothetical protein